MAQPMVVLVACGGSSRDANDRYRKPNPGMWSWLETAARDGGFELDPAASFFVGDAAGRPGDHSDSDLRFAANAAAGDGGLRFYSEKDCFERVFPKKDYADH